MCPPSLAGIQCNADPHQRAAAARKDLSHSLTASSRPFATMCKLTSLSPLLLAVFNSTPAKTPAAAGPTGRIGFFSASGMYGNDHGSSRVTGACVVFDLPIATPDSGSKAVARPAPFPSSLPPPSACYDLIFPATVPCPYFCCVTLQISAGKRHGANVTLSHKCWGPGNKSIFRFQNPLARGGPLALGRVRRLRAM